MRSQTFPNCSQGSHCGGARRGATAFYGVLGGWSGIASGYLLVCTKGNHVSYVLQFTTAVTENSSTMFCGNIILADVQRDVKDSEIK